MVQQTDVLICGSGSAGLCAAAWLAKSGIDFVILDKRSGAMERGQADGVQCRTVEIFESFGVSEELLRESFHILEVAFWSLNEQNKLIRTNRTVDTEPGLSHMPHVILNQAKLNKILLDYMQREGGHRVAYGYTVNHVQVPDPSESSVSSDEYPVAVFTEKDGVEEEFRAKYVLACDGAHSIIRKALGYRMLGDSTDAVWGVMDIYPRTTFPDIRRKSTIRSSSGNLLIIPREGGSLVRFYLELPPGTDAKRVTLADLHAAAKKIFTQYTLDVAETYWWSAYSIGQRLVDHFTAGGCRVFLTGDACHTHSPKAGQGMNVSLQDGYNIGWKLAHVLKGLAPADTLLPTYELERAKVAKDLIEFDRYFTRMFSSQGSATAKEFSEAFTRSLRYTAGLTATYDDSAIVAAGRSRQDRAQGVVVGMRFPSAQVVRFCDAKAIQLVKALPADGRWRIVVFGGDLKDDDAKRRLERLAAFLESNGGPVKRFTPKSWDIDAFIEPIVVLSEKMIELEQEQIPPYFWPETGKWKMRDLHKVFIDDESYNSGHGHAYEKYGVDVKNGALVILRPDQYVSAVLDIDDHKQIHDFFAGFALPQE